MSFLDDIQGKFKGNLRPLLVRWGQYQVERVKRRFEEKGPGWPPKHPYFAELEKRTTGGGQVPLTFRGRLATSITYDVPAGGRTLRVGSPLAYAARHQFGDDKMYFFNLYIQADKNPDGSPQRDEAGRILGKIVLKQAMEQSFANSIDQSRSERSRRSNFRRIKSIYKQRIGVKITARPFLLEPDQGEERDMIDIADQYLLGQSGKSGGSA